MSCEFVVTSSKRALRDVPRLYSGILYLDRQQSTTGHRRGSDALGCKIRRTVEEVPLSADRSDDEMSTHVDSQGRTVSLESVSASSTRISSIVQDSSQNWRRSRERRLVNSMGEHLAAPGYFFPRPSPPRVRKCAGGHRARACWQLSLSMRSTYEWRSGTLRERRISTCSQACSMSHTTSIHENISGTLILLGRDVY